ncbi:patatin-like phospholipase family protein [Massilia litorea]|uniref:Patatin-like phospholipase family protein n=1 Tax=Massilia litorea TaxID=2769491 RepID=A0A7L9TZD5_9BURK|nr:patatin-like phospholipase family protein [Massilia litorea]QOL48143.1 patatin-like phospholipase family protein [Massilia litorea]
MDPTTLPLCDIVMKGGVTSGIIYPRLASRLARDYRFKNIGGTSAGAIAAAACAAAELGRQSGRRPDAFDALDELPEQLGARSGRHSGGRSRLLHLFQPIAAAGRAFELLLAAVSAPNPGAAACSVLLRLAGAVRWPLLLLLCTTLAVSAATGLPWHRVAISQLAALGAAGLAGAIAWALAGRAGAAGPDRTGSAAFVAAAAGVLATGIYWRDHPGAAPAWLLAAVFASILSCAWGLGAALRGFLAALRSNFHGMCSGRTMGPTRAPALTDWLHVYLNELAGMAPGVPLTFGDLWHHGAATADEERAIDLQVVTTAVSQHTPYALPFRADAQAWYFDPDEWDKLFPETVLDYLRAAAKEGEPGPVTKDGRQLLPLPRAGALPVIVAVRMSLSFPILLSAIPLYAFDYTEKARHGPAPLKRVWFSDGGISSNLPLQFFDALLPRHPTFAVNLKREHPSFRIDDRLACPANGRAYLPRNNSAGRGRHWTEPAAESAGILPFLTAIVNTMQSWRDDILFPYAGYRDRVVHLSLKQDEGGLHLNMDPEQVGNLAAAGACAADQLRRRFLPASGDGWANHEEIRLISVLGNLEELALQSVDGATPRTWHDAVDRSRLDKDQAALAHRLLEALEGMAADIAASEVRVAHAMYRPSPTMNLGPNL